MVKDYSELDGLNHKEPISFSEMGNQERKRFFFSTLFLFENEE